LTDYIKNDVAPGPGEEKIPPVSLILIFDEIILRRLNMLIITILTPIIAIITVYIVYQQYRVNSLQLRWNL
jgi:hypothetical protein